MNNEMTTEKWCENVIIADGDYIDKVAFHLIVNFERMIGRRIPQADMARWIDCVALDGGLKPLEQTADSQTGTPARQISVVFIHDKKSAKLENFMPGHYADELHLKAFSDALGEFMMSAFPVEESVVSKRDFLAHHRLRHAAHARRQFPTGNTRILTHASPGHSRRRTGINSDT